MPAQASLSGGLWQKQQLACGSLGFTVRDDVVSSLACKLFSFTEDKQSFWGRTGSNCLEGGSLQEFMGPGQALPS